MSINDLEKLVYSQPDFNPSFISWLKDASENMETAKRLYSSTSLFLASTIYHLHLSVELSCKYIILSYGLSEEDEIKKYIGHKIHKAFAKMYPSFTNGKNFDNSELSSFLNLDLNSKINKSQELIDKLSSIENEISSIDIKSNSDIMLSIIGQIDELNGKEWLLNLLPFEREDIRNIGIMKLEFEKCYHTLFTLSIVLSDVQEKTRYPQSGMTPNEYYSQNTIFESVLELYVNKLDECIKILFKYHHKFT